MCLCVCACVYLCVCVCERERVCVCVCVSACVVHTVYRVYLLICMYSMCECYNIYIYIYIYAFSRRFYPKRLTLHSSYSFYILSALAFPGNRTHDLGVANAMLYQLSYRKAHSCSSLLSPNKQKTHNSSVLHLSHLCVVWRVFMLI